MKKFVIAPDKFKSSLTGIEFCNIAENEINNAFPTAEIVKLPLADGGDGTVEIFQYYIGGEIIEKEVSDPLFRKTTARYLFAKEKKIAFIEMAEASGIRILKNEELNPLRTTSYGTGELILDAMKKGAKHIVLGIGGSATTDAGIGMARALGFKFFDQDDNELQGIGSDLNKITYIENTMANAKLKEVVFEVACDVDNPLFGLNGAAHIYGPQKGATPEIVEALDMGLRNFNNIILRQYHQDLSQVPGAGAAGGLGAGAVLFLNATLKSGITIIKEIANFKKQIQSADWIITGEGRLDTQTFSGKVIKGILDEVDKQKIAAFCGYSEISSEEAMKHGIHYLSEMITKAKDTRDSMENSGKYLQQSVREFITAL